MSVVSLANGDPCRYITFIILAHGEDLRDQPTPPHLQNKIHKLMLSGISGNITQGSGVLDALFFNAARVVAHDRSTHHVDKLNHVRDEVFRYPHISDELDIQQTGQADFVADEMKEGRYQRVAESIGWIPSPSKVEYNRMFSFNANNWDDDDDAAAAAAAAAAGAPKPGPTRHKDAMEAREFGIWVVDASIDIANEIGFTPGIHPKVISLMPLLRTWQTTARKSPKYVSDTSGTETTLFELVNVLQSNFGENTYVNVIDLCCRFYNWDRHEPLARGKHETLARRHSKVDQWITPILPARVSSGVHDVLDRYWSDEVPSPAVDPHTVPRIIDYVSLPHGPLSEVVYWERNGAMKYQPITGGPLQCTRACESDVKYLINGAPYGLGLGDTMIVNGRDVTIFYILERGACFFVHDNETGRTSYVTPVIDRQHGESLIVTDDLSGLKYRGRAPFTPVINVKDFSTASHHHQARQPNIPPPFLPPYGYPSSRDITKRMGGARRRRSRFKVTKNKKHKRRATHARTKSRPSA